MGNDEGPHVVDITGAVDCETIIENYENYQEVQHGEALDGAFEAMCEKYDTSTSQTD